MCPGASNACGDGIDVGDPAVLHGLAAWSFEPVEHV
jgi:hypothetical protein